MGSDDDVEMLASRLADMVRHGMGSRSRWALRAGLDARESGVAGVFVFKIPAKVKDYPDVSFTVGEVDVVHRWQAS